MKVQVKRAFKSFFLPPKKKKKQTDSAWNLLQPPLQMWRGAYILSFKINALHFCCSLFFEEFLNPQVRINKIVNEHTVDYHPSPSELTSRIHPLTFLWAPKEFISPEYFLNFFSNLYIPPWLRKSLKFILLRLLENTFVRQKIEPNKNLAQVLIITPKTDGNYPFPPNSIFWKSIFHQAEMREDYGVEKITKIKGTTKVYFTHYSCVVVYTSLHFLPILFGN